MGATLACPGRPARGWTATALLVAAAVLAFVPAATAGDAELAKFLVKQGKTALDKGQVDDAVVKFRKALDEDPDTIEASWWVGQACEKGSETGQAIAAYRAYLVAYEAKRVAGRSTVDEATLAKKAQTRLDVIAVGDSEFRRLEEQYFAQVVGLARAQMAKDPVLAERAALAVLDLNPDHAEARKILDELGKVRPRTDAPPAKPAAAGGPAFVGLKSWADLLEKKAFDSPAWVFGERSLVVDLEGRKGTIAWAQEVPDPTEHFALEMEFRVLAEYGDGWHLGFTFGRQEGDFFAAIVSKSEVTLVHALEGSHEDLANVVSPAIARDAWHTFAVELDGTKVSIWLDGKKSLEKTIEIRARIEGQTGHWQQRMKAEYRRLRLGTKE